jgi:hypothetical protein
VARDTRIRIHGPMHCGGEQAHNGMCSSHGSEVRGVRTCSAQHQVFTAVAEQGLYLQGERGGVCDRSCLYGSMGTKTPERGTPEPYLLSGHSEEIKSSC